MPAPITPSQVTVIVTTSHEVRKMLPDRSLISAIASVSLAVPQLAAAYLWKKMSSLRFHHRLPFVADHSLWPVCGLQTYAPVMNCGGTASGTRTSADRRCFASVLR